jgi:DNA-directed RNA polymerase specialized sigma subunit
MDDDDDTDETISALESISNEPAMTYREIAAVLNTSKSNVENIANRALAKMRARLTKEWEDT